MRWIEHGRAWLFTCDHPLYQVELVSHLWIFGIRFLELKKKLTAILDELKA